MTKPVAITNYGNWVSTKLIYGPAVLGALFVGLSLLHPAFIIGAALFLAVLVYFAYARRAFSPRGGNIQAKLWEMVLDRLGWDGAGKTTFLRTLTGQIAPLAGDLHLGANLEIGYFAQAYHALDAEHTLLGEARSYLALAVLVLNKGNLLLLDEPTNHLDLPSQEALQEALSYYEGTILLVSHDRYLIDALTTQIWELRDDRLYAHKGDYQSFLAERQEMQEQAKQESIQDRSRGNVRPPVVKRPDFGENVVQTEDMIEEIEQHLARLGQDLIEATEAQRWERVRALNTEYQETQSKLDALLVQWEAMTVP